MCVKTTMDNSRRRSVRFAHPVVQSVSRRPLPQEFLYMNNLENHVERCILCEPEIGGRIPLPCRPGRHLRSHIRRMFSIHEDGRIYSTSDEYGPATWVEIPLHYWAVLHVLNQVHLEYVRHCYRHDADTRTGAGTPSLPTKM
jgi:hypothetical protein